MPFTPARNLVEEHQRWLSSFDPQYLRKWEKLLHGDPEAAMCEAEVRRLLQQNGNCVEPNEDLTGSRRSPDFRCWQAQRLFFVEVACLSIATVVKETGLSTELDRACEAFAPLNGAFFNASRKKTPQCSELPAPALVAVGTFHFQASQLCFLPRFPEMLLTGEQMITDNIDMRTGDAVGETYLSTQLCSATFLRPEGRACISYARNPVSGMLLCGFGCDPPEIRGVLHPSPVHELERSLLPNVAFCRLKGGTESGELSTEWV